MTYFTNSAKGLHRASARASLRAGSAEDAWSAFSGADRKSRYGAVEPAKRPSTQGVPRRRAATESAVVADAVQAVKSVAIDGDPRAALEASAHLRQLVRRDRDKRPRHAAIALAAADVLAMQPSGSIDVQQREALLRLAVLLLEPFVSASDEASVLRSLSRAKLDRYAPLDEGPLADLLARGQ